MSNYHYTEGGCSNCQTKSSYYDLDQTTFYDCDHPCTCRDTSERSNKDQMDYNYYVLGLPMNNLNGKNNNMNSMNKTSCGKCGK